MRLWNLNIVCGNNLWRNTTRRSVRVYNVNTFYNSLQYTEVYVITHCEECEEGHFLAPYQTDNHCVSCISNRNKQTHTFLLSSQPEKHKCSQAHGESCESHLAWETLHNPSLLMNRSYSPRCSGFIWSEATLYLHVSSQSLGAAYTAINHY